MRELRRGGVDPGRDARQRARAGAGVVGGRARCGPSPTKSSRSRTAGRLDDKSRWVSELERALLEGEIDIAVHSAKDVPAELADGLELVADPGARGSARRDLRRVVAVASFRRARASGTSSLRRAAQLRAARADLEVVEVRGNVDTRLRKLAEGECDALVLAVAGLAAARPGRCGSAAFSTSWSRRPGRARWRVEAQAGAAAGACRAAIRTPTHRVRASPSAS